MLKNFKWAVRKYDKDISILRNVKIYIDICTIWIFYILFDTLCTVQVVSSWLDFIYVFLCLFTGARKDLCDLWQTCKKLTLFFVLWRSRTSFCIWESFQYVKTFFCNISSFFFVSAESGAELVFILEKFCKEGAKLVIQEWDFESNVRMKVAKTLFGCQNHDRNMSFT